MNKFLYIALIIGFQISFSAFAEMNVPIQLRLKSPGGTYPTESNLDFKLLILSPVTNCILREESFSGQIITSGSISLSLGSGVRGTSDPSLSLNQVYDNSKTKTGLACVDANNAITLLGQSYSPAATDGRTIRIVTTIGGDPVLANFNMRATPYAIQAESVGGKTATDIIVKDTTTQLNQTNLNDLLFDVTRFNNLKTMALTGQATSATTATTAVNFSGLLVGDVSGTQGATSVDKIKGIPVSAAAPTAGQVLQYNGTQYVAATVASGGVTSVAGKTGVVSLVSADISGLGNASGLNVGSTAGTVAAGDDSRLLTAYSDTQAATAVNTASAIVKRDASGNVFVSNLGSISTTTNNLYLYDGVNSVRLKAPVGLGASYILTLPGDDGTVGQVLQTDGSGNLTWASAGGGSVAAVTASSPLSSSGGTNPNISISQSNSTTSGYLSATDWSAFNAKQTALGFTPLDAAVFNTAIASAACTVNQTMYWNSVTSEFLCQNISFPAAPVTSVAGRTGVITLASSDISGLGAAAAMNVGTSAGTVAAGNDSRIVNAFQTSSSLSGDVSGTTSTVSVNKIRGVAVSASAPTSGNILQYNGTQYVPTALPTAPVTSVAGRTGVITLASSDISGLGNAASLNIGTSAGTVAAGDDSRIVNAFQTSTSLSGDVSGLASALSVVKIRGVAVSASAPTSGNVLQYNGTQYVPTALPTAPVTSVAGRTGVITLASSDISGLGNAASLNIGTSAGTVAAGDDSRIVNAVQTSSVLSGDVSGTSSTVSVNKIRGVAVSASAPTSGNVLQYNGTQYVPVALPVAPVSSVAGRTGIITLASSDISGLGNAASLNIGTSTGTVAAGDDSRIVNAFQTSTSLSGDVSGLASALSVVKIRGVAVSASAPASGNVLQYNGTQYVPTALPTAPVTSVAGRTGVITLASSDISGLGNAASLNIGTSAGTIAAGDDTRIVNAVQTSSVLSGDVSGTTSTVSVNKIRGVAVSASAPTSGNVLQYNGTQYVPTALPTAPVTSVAGRTGVITLASSDISGLGGASSLNVGTTAGTVAAGDDSRIVNAVQTSSVLSGDVSGTSSTVSVNKIRGVAVSGTAPVAGNVLQFNGTQYVPVMNPTAPVSSVAGRTGAITLASSDISGLGGAAVLNVGTAAGTVAAGNDSRFAAALTSVAFNGYVASASCTTSQTMYWNSVSSQFLCQNISFPVTTVAGRTGAVTLASSDISGLGGAAALNVGAAAGTVAAGDDTRIVNALQPSTAFSGDVSGTASTISVNKIRNIAVSAAAPTTGQAMVFNGTQWVATTGFPTFARVTASQTFSSTTAASVTSLNFAVAAGVTYKYKFQVMYTSAATTTGLKIGLTYPAVTNASALANIASGVDGTGAYFQGVLNSSGDTVTATATPAIAPLVMLAFVEGIIVPSAAGTVQLTAGTEVAASNIVILPGSFVEVVIIP